MFGGFASLLKDIGHLTIAYRQDSEDTRESQGIDLVCVCQKKEHEKHAVAKLAKRRGHCSRNSEQNQTRKVKSSHALVN